MVHLTPGGTLRLRLSDKIKFDCFFRSPEFVEGRIELVYAAQNIRGISYSLTEQVGGHTGYVDKLVTIEQGLKEVVCRVYNRRNEVIGLSTASVIIGAVCTYFHVICEDVSPCIVCFYFLCFSFIEVKLNTCLNYI